MTWAGAAAGRSAKIASAAAKKPDDRFAMSPLRFRRDQRSSDYKIISKQRCAPGKGCPLPQSMGLQGVSSACAAELPPMRQARSSENETNSDKDCAKRRKLAANAK